MMSESINPILQWLNTHPNMAGLATFVVSAAESIAIIGTIIPGTVTMTAIGTLAGAGVIPLWSTIIWAILGAAVGDNLSYWAGRHFKNRLTEIWPFRTHPQILGSGEKFFHKYGILSVLIGRFIGPVRAIVPLVAGMLGMKPGRYIPVSIIASIAWAPAYMLPGILLGQAALEFPPDIAVHVVIMLLLVGMFIIICLWSIHKLFVLIRDQVTQFLNWVWKRLRASRYFNIVTTALKHHNPAKTHGQLALAFYLIVTFLAFLYLALYVLLHNSQDIVVNKVFFYFFRSMHSPMTDNIMLFITELGDKHVVIPVIVILFGWLAYTKRWYTAAHALALLLLTGGSLVIFKHLAHSARPWGILNSPESYSFPSGHTTLSTTFYVSLGLLLIHSGRFQHKRMLYFVIGLLIAAISVSRIYLGAHWFTDVLGGWLLSASLVMLICLSYNRYSEKNVHARSLMAIFFVSLFALAGSQYYFKYDQLKHNYTQLDWSTTTITLDNWWKQKGDNLPLFRIGRVGLPAEVFNLQWVGDINEIKTLLLQQGWENAPDRDWISVMHRVSDVSSAEHLPVVSPLYLDKKPVLVLVKHINGDKKIVVLRLWKANTTIEGIKESLWVGSVGSVSRTYSWLFNYKNNSITLDPALLFTTLPDQYDIKQMNVNVEIKAKHRWVQQAMVLIKPKNIEPAR
jgi:membrane protein DedA with SNARE-associated domain/membrane-associated phospholipid phosphatase